MTILFKNKDSSNGGWVAWLSNTEAIKWNVHKLGAITDSELDKKVFKRKKEEEKDGKINC